MAEFFRVLIEFQSGAQLQQAQGQSRSPATSVSITLESDDLESAKDDVAAWWGNRKGNLPGMFVNLLTIRMYTYAPKRIQKDGFLPPPMGPLVYEWDNSWGVQLGKTRHVSA